ncbi:protein rolling stone-like [Gigantopelta aegis]|uniref:protein rolling stone-like n=1 Tax=Gigantopelta aegis TaxID=1735272 RepID=UPI001B88D0BE|nr:protein rolling stone-like [Gigantopelta aegis]
MSDDQRQKRCVNCDGQSFGLTHEPREDFILSQWSDLPLPYAILRSMFALYAIAIVFYSGLDGGHGEKIFIWMTYWVYYIFTTNFIVAAANTWTYWLYGRRRKKLECLQSAWFSSSLKVQWVLHNLSGNGTFIATAMFWTVVYNGESVSFVTMNVHGISLVLVILDFTITRCPIRIHHFYLAAIFSSTYSLFTVVYWAAGGTNTVNEPFIYNVLDYSENPRMATAYLLSITLIVVPLIHCLMYAIYRLRIYIHQNCCWPKKETEPTLECEKISIEL